MRLLWPTMISLGFDHSPSQPPKAEGVLQRLGLKEAVHSPPTVRPPMPPWRRSATCSNRRSLTRIFAGLERRPGGASPDTNRTAAMPLRAKRALDGQFAPSVRYFGVAP